MKKRLSFFILFVLLLVPLISLRALADENNISLPKGYVDPETYFTRDNKEIGGTPVINTSVNDADGFYIGLVEVKPVGLGRTEYHYAFGADLNKGNNQEFTYTGIPNQTWERDAKNDSFTISGSRTISTYGINNVPNGGLLDYSSVYYEYTYNFTTTFSNIRFGENEYAFNADQVRADITGQVEIIWSQSDSKTGEYKSGHEIRKIDAKDCRNGGYWFDRDRNIATLDFWPGAVADNGNKIDDEIGFEFEIYGIKPKKKGFSVIQRANNTAGEDEGVSVPAAIAIGFTAGATALAGALIAGSAGASGAAGADNKKTPSPQSSYKMYVQKDFGDSVRKDGKPVKIRARMAEINSSGSILDRNDLTSKITASGDKLQIQSLVVAGRYIEATVIAPPDLKDDEGSITFTFSGIAGAFSNTVLFRLVGGPSLKFVEETSPGSGAFKTCNENTSFDMIPGDGFTYTDLFMIEDAPVPPELKDIYADSLSGFDISFEKTNRQAVYKLIVKNNTPAETNDDIFAKPKEMLLQFHVLVEGEKEPLNGYARLMLYPEGLTVSSRELAKKKEIQYVRVQAYEKEYVGDLDRKWQVSEMIFTLAVKGKDRAIINPKEMSFTFEKIKGGGGLGTQARWEESLANKYEYEESHGYYNDNYTYTFDPRINLVEPDDGTFFIVMLPACCTYDGTKYTADVPLRLRGKDPDPYEGWDEEYRKLQERVEKYSLPEDKDYWKEKLEAVATDPRSSRAQLRLLSKYIVRQYMMYWTNESIAARNDAEIYDTIVSQLEFVKFIGDCAFSFLLAAYAGPVAEAIISPAKDFATEAIGEYIAACNYGTEFTAEQLPFAKNLEAAGDNLVSNNISLTNWRKAAATLAAYFVYSAIKNYIKHWREKGESNFWGSFVDAFSDMTAQGLKAAAGELFTKWIKNNKKFQEKVGNEITKFFNKNLGKGRTFNLKDQKIKNVQYQLNDALELDGNLRKLAGWQGESKKILVSKIDYLQKVLQEFVGKYAGWVTEDLDKATNTDGTFAIGENGHILFKFTLDFLDYNEKFLITIDFNQIVFSASTLLFGVLWNLIFGEVPSAVTVIQPPNDPPLPPKGE